MVAKVVTVACRNTHWSDYAYKLWIKSPFILMDMSKIGSRIYTVFTITQSQDAFRLQLCLVLWCCLSKESPVFSSESGAATSSRSSAEENSLFLQYWAICDPIHLMKSLHWREYPLLLLLHLWEDEYLVFRYQYSLNKTCSVLSVASSKIYRSREQSYLLLDTIVSAK